MTDTIVIKYRDGSGQITERRISDVKPESATKIDAFCHLREERRSFNLDRIVYAIKPDTGEIFNPWKLIDLKISDDDRESLESMTWFAMPAIKALKFFMLTTRGSRKREIERLLQTVKLLVDVSCYSDEELTEWIKQLPCWDMHHAWRRGDTSEYLELLRRIPQTMLSNCHAGALRIAMGSGRRPLDTNWAERINNEFASDPYVKPPNPTENEGVILAIAVKLPQNES